MSLCFTHYSTCVYRKEINTCNPSSSIKLEHYTWNLVGSFDVRVEVGICTGMRIVRVINYSANREKLQEQKGASVWNTLTYNIKNIHGEVSSQKSNIASLLIVQMHLKIQNKIPVCTTRIWSYFNTLISLLWGVRYIALFLDILTMSSIQLPKNTFFGMLKNTVSHRIPMTG